MAALGVDPPNVITRVSEFLPEIIEYIEKIMQNGYAYESEGSVYFDIEAFRTNGKHIYAKLEPGSFNDLNRISDGEGALGEVSSQKKSPYDFALWKKAKPGEPFWPSPWGNGRPGKTYMETMLSEIIVSHVCLFDIISNDSSWGVVFDVLNIACCLTIFNAN